MIEHSFSCPYCWQPISVLLDPSVANQTYIEDCEGCCNPMRFEIQFGNQKHALFEAEQVD